jgi:FMN phosphatase YigB (HAD superfamily)
MDKPSWILFDNGGVLLDWRSSLSVAAGRLGITLHELLNILFDERREPSIGVRMLLGEITAEAGWGMVLKQLGKPDYTPADMLTLSYAKEYWLPDTLHLLTELKHAGYQMALMSN